MPDTAAVRNLMRNAPQGSVIKCFAGIEIKSPSGPRGIDLHPQLGTWSAVAESTYCSYRLGVARFLRPKLQHDAALRMARVGVAMIYVHQSDRRDLVIPQPVVHAQRRRGFEFNNLRHNAPVFDLVPDEQLLPQRNEPDMVAIFGEAAVFLIQSVSVTRMFISFRKIFVVGLVGQVADSPSFLPDVRDVRARLALRKR